MSQEQLKQLFISFCVGYFQNNYIKPKYEDIDAYTLKLKRLFRTFSLDAFAYDPITDGAISVDFWPEAVEAAMGYM